MARAQYANLDFLSANKIINLPDPTSPQDAATKHYVDAVAQGLEYHQEVQAATTGALPANTYSAGVITASGNGALTVDGYVVLLNDRLVVKNEGTGANDGIYYQSQLGDGSHPYILTRATDAVAGTELSGGAAAYVVNGTANGNSWAIQTTATVTIGTTSQTWTILPAGIALPVSVSNGGTGNTTAGAARGTSGLGAATSAPTGGATARGIPTKVDQTITAPSAGSYTITHNLGTSSVIVDVIDQTTNLKIDVDWATTNSNVVTVTFNSAESNNVLVVVIG